MSFVPLTGPATLHVAQTPREGTVEFTDDRRTITLPIRAALPVLAKARNADDAHPSVVLLAAASLLGMRFVAAGKFEPGDGAWRLAPLDSGDGERLRGLAEARAYDGLRCRRRRDRRTPRGRRRGGRDAARRRPPRPATCRDATRDPAAFARRLQDLVSRHRGDRGELPQLVTLSLRVEADEEELVAGSCRLVLQVHDERDPLHVRDAASLWADAAVRARLRRPRPDPRDARAARRRGGLAAAGAAARAARSPTSSTLDTDDLVSLLEHGVAALRDVGVDVLWPRSLGRDLRATATLDRTPGKREGQLVEGVLSGDALFAFNWQIALRGDPLTEQEMDQLARASSPMLRLRGGWTVVDPAIARKARKRLIRTVRRAQAVAAALTGVVEIEDAPAEVVVGASLLQVREQLLGAADGPAARLASRPGRDAARLPAPRLHLARPR